MLITSVGTIGNVYRVSESNLPFYFKDGNVTWVNYFDPNYISSSYLYLWFKSNYGQDAIRRVTIGSTQKALTISAIQKFEIKVPTIADLKIFSGEVEPLLETIDRNLCEIKTLTLLRDSLLPKLMSGKISVID